MRASHKELWALLVSGVVVFLTLFFLISLLKKSETSKPQEQQTKTQPQFTTPSRSIPWDTNFDKLMGSTFNQYSTLPSTQSGQNTELRPMNAEIAGSILAVAHVENLKAWDIVLLTILLTILWASGTFFTVFAKASAERLCKPLQ